MPQPIDSPSLHAVRQAGTGASGFLYVNPPNVTSQRINSQFNVSIKVSGMDYFTGWDVSVETNTSSINPIKISIAGNLFEANYSNPPREVSNCVNGNGQSCILPPTGFDGPGIAHSAADLFGHPAIPAPIDGTLFVITYNITSNPSYSPIRIVSDTLTNNTLKPVPNTPQDGVYGTPGSPDFTLSLSTRAITIAQGTSASLTVSLRSLLKFNGTVALSTLGKLNGTFAQPFLNLTATKGTNSTRLTLSAPTSLAATSYLVTMVADYSTTIRHLASVLVTVQLSAFFLLGLSPAQLAIHGGTSGNTTILLTSQFNFSGKVDLTVRTGTTSVTYRLASSSLILTPYQSNSTLLELTVPFLAEPFTYFINVTASHRFSSTWQNVTQSLKIVPPKPSLAIDVIPSFVYIRAGQSVNVSITVWSVDYFVGNAYVSAVMSGGRASFDHYISWIALPNSTYSSNTPSANYTLTIKVGARTIAGNYVVLLTAYSIANGPQAATSTQGIILITIANPTLFHTSSTPITLLGLDPTIYFLAIGIVAVPFAVLGILALRKWLDDQDYTYLTD